MVALFLSLVLAAPTTADAGTSVKPPFRWNVPQVVESVPVSGELRSMGIPVRAHAFKSKADETTLMLDLVKAFKQQGLWIPPHSAQFHMPGINSLTAIDDTRMITYTVIFLPQSDGTNVIIGEADHTRATKEGEPDFAPVMPGAQAVTRSSSEGLEQMTYSVKAKRADAESFYREVLTRAGYRELEAGVFGRSSDSIRILLAEEEGADLAVAVIRQLRAAPPPSPQK